MTYRLLINGKLVDGAHTLDVVNPATGKVFETCARADSAQLEEAVASAKAAFPAWAARPYSERQAMLSKFADAIEARSEEIQQVLTKEQGKPLFGSEIELMLVVGILRFFSEQELTNETIRKTETDHIIRQRTPLGVIAAIVPWNFPLLLLITKLSPGLLVGNTMIAKPAPTTPLTTLLLGEIAADIFPAGVLSTIVDANDLGATLSAHKDIAKVSFTGSTATGKLVVKSAADTLKRMTMELGGNDAAIVLDDANIKETAQKVFSAATFNSGQVCLAAKRIYVPSSMYDEFCSELVVLANKAVVGDGADPTTEIGPIQNKMQFEKVITFLDDAKKNGKVIAGGDPIDSDGFFIPVTVVRDIADNSQMVCEEQFGPIIPVLSYDSIEEVIERANDSDYGLGGTIWTADPQRGIELAMKIDTGTVWINKHLDTPFDVPLGGSKQSGFGVEYGVESLHEYTQAKTINAAL